MTKPVINETWMDDDQDTGAVAGYGCLSLIVFVVGAALFTWFIQ